MKWYRKPRLFRWSFLLFGLGAFLAQSQLLLMENVPLSSIPKWLVRVRPFSFLALSLAAWSGVIILVYGFQQMKEWAWRLILIGLVAWNLINLLHLARSPSFWFAVFGLAVLAYSLVLLAFWRSQWSLAFVRPEIPWFQGLPVSIPRLSCHWLTGNPDTPKIPFRLSRITHEGAFILVDQPNPKLDQAFDLEIRFRDKEVICRADPACFVPQINGLGVYFDLNTADIKKDLGDLIELLKGGGYAETSV